MERGTKITLPEGYLDFYRALESWQNVEQMKLRSQLPPPREIDGDGIIRELRKCQQPLFLLTPVPLSPELYRATWLGLLDFLREQRPDLADKVELLRAQADALDFAAVIEQVLTQQDGDAAAAAEAAGVPAELCVFTLDHALRPFLRVLAEPFYEIIEQDSTGFWEHPTRCPLCGGVSRISRFRGGDGKRFMFCDRCSTEWNTNYLFCVHCHSTEVLKVKFITMDEAPPYYKLLVCDTCQGYAKCYDERNNNGEIRDMFIVNMETIYLDILATDKGYHIPE